MPAPGRTVVRSTCRPWSACGSGYSGARSSDCRTVVVVPPSVPGRPGDVVAVRRVVGDRHAVARARRRGGTGARRSRTARRPRTCWCGSAGKRGRTGSPPPSGRRARPASKPSLSSFCRSCQSMVLVISSDGDPAASAIRCSIRRRSEATRDDHDGRLLRLALQPDLLDRVDLACTVRR